MMTSIIALSSLTALFSSIRVLTQTTETAWLLIVDDAFAGTYQGDYTFTGSADISETVNEDTTTSVTEYTINCPSGMHGCGYFGDDLSFYFSEVSGTTTYTIDDGPNR